MLALTPFVTVLSAVALVASARPIPARRGQPTDWHTGYLESYDTYHTRYLEIGCSKQQGTEFFDACCHPLLATESLSIRPDWCPTYMASQTSTSAVVSTSVESASASAASASASSVAEEEATEEYCDEEEEQAASSVAAASTPAPAATTSTPAPAAYVAPTTSAAPAPAATTSEAAAPVATTSEAAAPAATTSEAAAPAPATGGDVQGDAHATYYYQSGNAGACGDVNPESAMIAAIPYKWWNGSDSQRSSRCGQYIDITRVSTGKKITVKVADLCPTCTTDNSLDLSEGAFNSIATPSEGQVDITWTWA